MESESGPGKDMFGSLFSVAGLTPFQLADKEEALSCPPKPAKLAISRVVRNSQFAIRNSRLVCSAIRNLQPATLRPRHLPLLHWRRLNAVLGFSIPVVLCVFWTGHGSTPHGDSRGGPQEPRSTRWPPSALPVF